MNKNGRMLRIKWVMVGPGECITLVSPLSCIVFQHFHNTKFFLITANMAPTMNKSSPPSVKTRSFAGVAAL